MNISRKLRYGAALTLLVAAALYFSDPSFPEPSEVHPLILRGVPLQREVTAPNFTKAYGDIIYTYIPRAEYEVSGVVVSLHHSDSFVDITHEYDPANTLDLCLAWGTNVETDAYRKVEYSHGDFTCFYRWWGEDPGFRGDEMSNTHIIPSTPELSRLAKSVRVGDQVTLRGTLVDYKTTFPDGKEIDRRNTSMVREDAGNGACEILYLEDLRILARREPWREPLRTTLLLLAIFGFVLAFYLEIRRMRSIAPAAPSSSELPPRAENPLDPRNDPHIH